MENPRPLLDAGVIAELRKLSQGAAPGFLAELIDVFLRQSQELLGQARAALGSKDEAALQRAAHTLKGSSGSMGALRLYDLSRLLEDAARKKDWAASESLIPRVEAEGTLVRGALEAEKARPA